MKRVDFHIGQVIFERSPVGLAEQLRRTRGVTDVSVDIGEHMAHVTYDDTKLNLADVQRLVAECGHSFDACSSPLDVGPKA